MSNLRFDNSNRPESIAFTQGLVEHRDFQIGLMHINNAHKSHSSDPVGLMLLGEPGVGKTRLARFYKEYFDKSSTEEADRNTVLIVEMPASTSIDRFYTKILSSLNVINPSRGKIPYKEERIFEQLKRQEVEILLIDEIHNLLPNDADGTKTRVIANTLKGLMNETGLPMVLIGEKRAESLKISHQAIMSRFQNTVYLTAMKYHSENDKAYFQEYLKGLQKHIAVPCINMAENDFAMRMYAASDGIPREIRKIIVASIDFMKADEKIIEPEHFAFGFAMSGSMSNKMDFNPFDVSKSKVEKYLRIGK